MTDSLATDHDQPSRDGGLGGVLDGVAEGILLFGADDRLMLCNAMARDFFAPADKAMTLGTDFAEFTRALAETGAVDLDGQSAEAWAQARLDAHRNADGPFEQRLADGRWLRVSESATGDGGMLTVCSDITAQKQREHALLEGEKHYQQLNEIGVALSSEKNVDRLLEMILLEAKGIANADGGTIYLYIQVEEQDRAPADQRIDHRSGGDRRCGHERRGGEHAQRGAAGDAPLDRSGRRLDVDRRQHPDALKFAIMRNDTLDIAMGGTTGKEIPIPPLRIYDPITGEGNYRNVATVAALTGKTVNIPDAYTSEEFDFSGTKAFDEKNNYRSKSFLTIPMKNKQDEVIGILQLINARDRKTGETIAFDPEQRKVIESLASQAAVALDNQMLIEGQRELLDSFIQLIASAIDEKSPYTGGHCARVPVLTEMLADAASAAAEGPFKHFHLNDEEMYELHIAGWMHDCGKVTTPEYVVDKSTKLETIYDRIETVRTRFEVLKRDAEVRNLVELGRKGVDRKKRAAEFRNEIKQLEADRAFLEEANIGGEFMDDDKKERVRRIAKLRWRGPDGEEQDFLSDDEVYNLCIGRGTLTNEERKIINNHIVVTIEMLEKLPFPKGLKRVPEYAGGHHEKMDGTGYPRGLTREQMSTPARMMAIADIFEALTAADRPYKKAKTLSESMAIMARMRDGNHIDPDLFELFVEAGVYLKYAEKFLAPEQIDEVDDDALLRRAPESS